MRRHDWLFKAPLLCVLGIAGLLVNAGCHKEKPTGVFVDPAFGPLVPADTKLMAGIRLDKVRDTTVYKKLNTRFDLQRHLDLFAQRTGLDPRKNLWQILLVSNGTDQLVMARGRFTTGELEPRLGELGGTRTKYKEYNLIGTPETSVVFMNPGVAVASNQAALRRLIDNRASQSQIPAQFNERLKSLPYSDQLWLIAEGDFKRFEPGGPDTTGARSLLSNFIDYIRTIQMGVALSDGAELTGSIDCDSAEGAQRVRDAMKGIVGMARLSTRPEQMQLLKVYDTVKVDQQKSTVRFGATVAPDLVEPLLAVITSTRH